MLSIGAVCAVTNRARFPSRSSISARSRRSSSRRAGPSWAGSANSRAARRRLASRLMRSWRVARSWSAMACLAAFQATGCPLRCGGGAAAAAARARARSRKAPWRQAFEQKRAGRPVACGPTGVPHPARAQMGLVMPCLPFVTPQRVLLRNESLVPRPGSACSPAPLLGQDQADDHGLGIHVVARRHGDQSQMGLDVQTSCTGAGRPAPATHGS